MAFGSPPKHTQTGTLDGLTQEQYLAISVLAIQAIGWKITYISQTGLVAYTVKTLMKAQQKITVRIMDDQVVLRSESIAQELFDLGKNKKNVEEFTHRFEEKKSTDPQLLADVYSDLKPSMPPPEEDVLAQPPATRKQQWKDVGSLFIPRGPYFITPLLIDLNILIFIAMAVSGVNIMEPTTASLLKWGANIRFLTLDGQWWRLVTNCFIHIGIVHILVNMYSLMYIGVMLEPRLGKGRFAAAYLLTGIIASLNSLYWHTNTVSAGASGAIFGVIGVFLALLTTNLIEKTQRKALLTSIGIFVVFNLFYGTKEGVDNAAHLGGLISGVIIGYLYYPGLKKPERPILRVVPIVIAVGLVAVTSLVASRRIPNDYGLYDQKLDSFAHMEERALIIYNFNDSTPKNVWLNTIRDTGIYYWKQSLRVLDEANALDVSANLKKRDGLLIRYCDLRLLSYDYMYRKIDGTVPADVDSIGYYNTQISALIDSLKKPN